jgi:general nucleoside transport system permease protein
MIRQLFESTLRVSTPLIFAALGGMFSERSGVINIALEGMMLVGAFGAAVGTLATHSPWLGSACGMGAGAVLALVYGIFVIRLRANQIVAGTAINMLALGLTPFLCKLRYDVTGQTPAIPMADRFEAAPLYLSWALVVICWLWLKYTRQGLWLSFAGEHPEALDAAGIRVNHVRWAAVAVSGALAGMGGASLSVFLSSSWTRNMTAGRGFMALAALIFGKWRPVPTAIACLLFGFAEAVQIRLQGVVLWGQDPIPVQFIQILPYIVTILVLAGFVGRSRAPKALGTVFSRS